MTQVSHTTKGRIFIGCILISVISLVFFFTKGQSGYNEAIETQEIYFRTEPISKVYRLVNVGAKSSKTFLGLSEKPISKGKLFTGKDEKVVLVFERDGFETVTKEFSGQALAALKQSSVYPEETVPAISLGAKSSWSKMQVRIAEQWLYLLVSLGFGLAALGFHIFAINPAQKRAYALVNLRAQGTGDDKYIGTLVKDYRIIKLLGIGGCGAVYKAVPDSLFGTPKALEQAVAIKFCIPNAMSDLEEIRERFRYEVKASRKLSAHPNIVTYIEDGETDDPDPEKRVPYLIMEYVAGTSLDALACTREEVRTRNAAGDIEVREVVTYHAFPPQKIHEFLAPIADALEYAHQQNFSHRDLKPLNIIIEDGGRPVLLDFGLAKTEDNKLTKTGIALGTSIYMPKEQWEDTKRTTSKVDVYALGIMIYHLLSGQTPFGGETRPLGIAQMILSGTVLKLQDVKADLSPELVAVVEKMTALNPQDRYQSPKKALEDFAKALES